MQSRVLPRGTRNTIYTDLLKFLVQQVQSRGFPLGAIFQGNYKSQHKLNTVKNCYPVTKSSITNTKNNLAGERDGPRSTNGAPGERGKRVWKQMHRSWDRGRECGWDGKELRALWSSKPVSARLWRRTSRKCALNAWKTPLSPEDCSTYSYRYWNCTRRVLREVEGEA